MENLNLCNRIQNFMCTLHPQFVTQLPLFYQSKSQPVAKCSKRLPLFEKVTNRKSQMPRNLAKVYAMRRRRSNTETDTYVLMEPGKNEEFVSEEELKDRLKGWLEKWPGGNGLPPDLARFDEIGIFQKDPIFEVVGVLKNYVPKYSSRRGIGSPKIPLEEFISKKHL